MSKILVAYYSFSGTTAAFAEKLAGMLNADLRPLVPETPYDFSRNTATKDARNEIARGYCPKLQSGNEPIDGYDIIFAGTPNWFRDMAPPLLTFLRMHDFSGKTIIPFCTHGGGGFGDIEKRIAEECAGAVIRPGFAGDGKELAKWLKDAQII